MSIVAVPFMGTGFVMAVLTAVKILIVRIAMKHGTARDVRIVLVMKPIYAEDAAIVTAVRLSARNVVKNVQNVQTGFVMTAENVLNVWEIRIIVNIVICVLSAQAAMFVYVRKAAQTVL